MEKTVRLEIKDQGSAILYMGGMQSRAMDAVHEPIQNLLDAGACKIDVKTDNDKGSISVVGNSKPIQTVDEMERILTSICASNKAGKKKLGEKGIGLLSFIAVGDSMTMTSQSGGKVVSMTLYKDDILKGKVRGSQGNQLPYAGTEHKVKGINLRNMKSRFVTDRIIKDVKRRWGTFLAKGISISVNGKDVASSIEPLEGTEFKRTIKLKGLGQNKEIIVDLILLKDPSETATVSVTHRGQANFLIQDIPLFERHNAFTQGMLHGTITGDAVSINVSRTGFIETGKEFDTWVNEVVEIQDELGKLISERIKTTAESRNAKFLTDFMDHLRGVFKGTEIESVSTVIGPGTEIGVGETKTGIGIGIIPTGSHGGHGGGHGTPSGVIRQGGPGRLPTVPSGGLTTAPPNVRVVRDRKTFHINVCHPDYVSASKTKHGPRLYIKEVCLQEAYIFSLDGEQKKQYEDRSDEFLGYWTKAYLVKEYKG